MKKPKLRIPMFGKAKIQNSSVWKSQNSEFQSLEKSRTRIPVTGKAKLHNSNVSKTENLEFQFFVKAEIKNSIRKSQKPEFPSLEKPKTRIPMFGKAKIQNSNVWKSRNSEF